MSGVLKTLIEAAIFALVVAAPFFCWWLKDRLQGKSTGDDGEPMPNQDADRYDYDDMFSDRHLETRDEHTRQYKRERH